MSYRGRRSLLLPFFAMGALAACSTAPAATDGGPVPDAAAFDAPTGDDGATDASATDTGPMGSPDGGFLDYIATPGPTITVAGTPIAIRSNATTGRLYVSLRMPTGIDGAGIVVIDEASNTIVTTVPPPTPMFIGMPAAFQSMVIDETTNRVYLGASASDGGAVRVLDGATNTMSMIARPDSGANGIGALAIDPGAQRLYAWVSHSPNPEIAVWDTQTNTLVTTVAVTDLRDGSAADALALDPTSHRMFVCGTTTASSLGAACDVFDTTTNGWMGTQQTFDPTTDGYFVGCAGGPGYAFVVTNGTTSDPAVLDELEPARYRLPPGFEPVRVRGVEAHYSITIGPDIGGHSYVIDHEVYIYGTYSSGSPRMLRLAMSREEIVNVGGFSMFDALFESAQPVTSDTSNIFYTASSGTVRQFVIDHP